MSFFDTFFFDLGCFQKGYAPTLILEPENVVFMLKIDENGFFSNSSYGRISA